MRSAPLFPTSAIRMAIALDLVQPSPPDRSLSEFAEPEDLVGYIARQNCCFGELIKSGREPAPNAVDALTAAEFERAPGPTFPASSARKLR